MNSLLIKSYLSGAVVAGKRFVKFGATEGEVIQAAAATDLIAGVSDLGADAIGDTLDVHHVGITPIELGGNVTQGQRVTSDAVGRAVAAGLGANVGAIALESGVLGDHVPCLVVLYQLN